MIEEIKHAGELLGVIVRNSYRKPGISFFTPEDFSQQLAYMCRPAGYQIQPHVHNKVARAVHYTQEVLFLRKGRLQVDFYNDQRQYLESRILSAGDVILLASGGHGFTALEEIEMIEVKQGPYAGEQDKTRFSGISQSQVRIKA